MCWARRRLTIVHRGRPQHASTCFAPATRVRSRPAGASVDHNSVATGCRRGLFTVPGCLLRILPTVHRKRACKPGALACRTGGTVASCRSCSLPCFLLGMPDILAACITCSLHEGEAAVHHAGMSGAAYAQTRRLSTSQRPAVSTCMLGVPSVWLPLPAAHSTVHHVPAMHSALRL